MLRNINELQLFNGTRLAVKKLMNNVVEANISKGKYKWLDPAYTVCIPILMDFLFVFNSRFQFPVRLAFATAVNKSQGQLLQVCGINLEFLCITHGQLYVAYSRVVKQ